MPSLLVEIGCEELPAAACYEAEAQLRDHVRAALGLEPTQVFVSPRRVAFLVEDAPAESAPTWVSGPPPSAPDTAKEGFARKHGVAPGDLEERDGRLGIELPGRPLAEVVKEQLDELVFGLSFSKSMRWRDDGRRFSRPVRWVLVKLDGETIAGESSFGRRFVSGAVEIPDGRWISRRAARGRRRARPERAAPADRRGARRARDRRTTRWESSTRSCTCPSGRSCSKRRSTRRSSGFRGA